MMFLGNQGGYVSFLEGITYHERYGPPVGSISPEAFRESFHVMDSALDVTGGVSQVFSSPKLTANAPENNPRKKEVPIVFTIISRGELLVLGSVIAGYSWL